MAQNLHSHTHTATNAHSHTVTHVWRMIHDLSSETPLGKAPLPLRLGNVLRREYTYWRRTGEKKRLREFTAVASFRQLESPSGDVILMIFFFFCLVEVAKNTSFLTYGTSGVKKIGSVGEILTLYYSLFKSNVKNRQKSDVLQNFKFTSEDYQNGGSKRQLLKDWHLQAGVDQNGLRQESSP